MKGQQTWIAVAIQATCHGSIISLLVSFVNTLTIKEKNHESYAQNVLTNG